MGSARLIIVYGFNGNTFCDKKKKHLYDRGTGVKEYLFSMQGERVYVFFYQHPDQGAFAVAMEPSAFLRCWSFDVYLLWLIGIPKNMNRPSLKYIHVRFVRCELTRIEAVWLVSAAWPVN